METAASYLWGFVDKITAIYETARRSPEIFFPILLVSLLLIWLKWRLVGKGVKSAVKDNYAGWVTNASTQDLDLQTFLIMKPIKYKRIAFSTLAFFGGGALFYWLHVLEQPDAVTKDYMVFAGLLVFSVLGVWLLWFSTMRILVFSDRIERRMLFRSRFVATLTSLTKVEPINKTVAGGVYLTFEDGRRLRIISRMSGYRQLLERLAQTDPKLRLLTKLFSKQAETYL